MQLILACGLANQKYSNLFLWFLGKRKMSHCVPSWEINGSNLANPRRDPRLHFNSNLCHVPSMLDDGHQVPPELMWENGNIALQHMPATGKTMPILIPSPEINFRYEFEKPRAGGTLESVVNQGTRPVPVPVPVPQMLMDKDPVAGNSFLWFYGPAANLTAMDALVPCSAAQVPDIYGQDHEGLFAAGNSTGVGSCSGRDHREGRKRRRNETREESSAARVPSSEWSDTFEWQSGQMTSETERETGTWGFTSTSMTCASPENTSSADQRCSTHEYDSACHSRIPQEREVKRSRVESMKKSNVKSSTISSQRSSTAFSSTHNQRRKDKIKERMATLRKMVPNSNKVDKVAVLDELIEHLKQLQSQVEMLNGMNMVAPPTLTVHQHQHLQLQMMLNMMMMLSVPTAFMGMQGLGMGVGLGPNAFARFSSSAPTRHAGPFNNAVPPPTPVDFINNTTTSPFLMQTHPMSMFPAYPSQSQSQLQQLATMDGYGRMTAFFNHPQSPQLRKT